MSQFVKQSSGVSSRKDKPKAVRITATWLRSTTPITTSAVYIKLCELRLRWTRPCGSCLELDEIGGIIGGPIRGSRGVKSVRLVIANPVFALSFAVLAGLLGFVVTLLASVRAIASIVGGLDGIALALAIGFPSAIVLAVLSFIFTWKKFNA